MAEPRQILAIQYLRALAALAVVVVHNLERSDYPFVVGEAGVDLFFVISGFVMWTLADAQQPSAQVFLWRRIIRIVPLYWAATLVAIVGARLKPGFFWNYDVGFDNVWKSLLFIPHNVASGGWNPVVGQGWTLTYEMFFYVLFAFALLAKARWRFFVPGAMLLLLVAGGVYRRNDDPVWLTYTNPLLLEFLAGIALGALWRRASAREAARPGAWAGGVALLTLGFGALAVESAMHWMPVHDRSLIWGIPAVFIVSGALALERAGRVPRLRLPLLLGDASYSIYLLHAFVTLLVYDLIPGINPTAQMLVATPLSAAIGIASYLLYERPVTGWFKRLGRAPATKLAPV